MILKAGQIRATKFDFSDYLEKVLPSVDTVPNLPAQVLGQRAVPYLGEGIYCFNQIEGAIAYPNGTSVVTITYSQTNNSVDVDDPKFLLNLEEFLSNEFMNSLTKGRFYDAETVENYRILKENVLNLLYEDDSSRNCPQVYAIALFLFYWAQRLDYPDILYKKFPECKYTYYLLKKLELVENVS